MNEPKVRKLVVCAAVFPRTIGPLRTMTSLTSVKLRRDARLKAVLSEQHKLDMCRSLRADCGIGLLDCKKSLETCDYDYAKARVYALHVQSSRVMVTRRNAQGGLI